jgi:hypothetical protein
MFRCQTLESQVEAFWELESVPRKTVEPSETVIHDIRFDGERYSVPLLWSGNERPADNREVAEDQCHRLRIRLNHEGNESQYNKVLEEYKTFGAIEKDPDSSGSGYFVPHHPVIRASSETHKLRIVFNASAKTSNGLSLNDCLSEGENLLPSIFDILLSFRKGSVAATADIEKAFLTVAVHDEDRKFLKLIWDSPLRLCRVPFGLKCSPYLLNSTVIHHLNRLLLLGKISLNLYRQIRDCLYVDDFVRSFKCGEERILFKEDVIRVFRSAGMNVHKWVFSGEPTEKVSKVLGLRWNSFLDLLSVESPKNRTVRSKREFLSFLSSIYDPLGLISPLVVTGKILLQQMWKVESLSWDDAFPEEMQNLVSKWLNSFECLPSFSTPRCILPNPSQCELHVFSDASEKAYGACAYIVSDGAVNLACSKSRVAPLKVVSLPRLELQAALMGAQLADVVVSLFAVRSDSVFLWSDSRITLAWIQSPSYSWKTYVANRVTMIHELTASYQWRHIPSESNPADLVSRGTFGMDDLNSSFWRNGPEWLVNKSLWPAVDVAFRTDEERKHDALLVGDTPHSSVLLSAVEPESILSKLQKWSLSVRALARILRLKYLRENLDLSLQPFELRRAELKLIGLLQRSAFRKEIEALESGYSVSKSSTLWELRPQLEDGLLVVGGRLEYSSLPQRAKRPYILPKNHPVVKDLVRHTHVSLLHAGPNTVRTELRKRFWIVGVKRLCQNVKHECLRCVRFDSKIPAVNQIVAPLPHDRVTLIHPFHSVGLDYAGPLFTTDVGKVYILLFVCSAVRAVHLELCHSLETEGFLLAFRRFVSRCGQPVIVRSDNAKTFKRASELLSGITWLFNPPVSPWWGGFFEIMVKLIKRPLRKTLLNASVSSAELQTILCEIQRAVNLRPISTLSEDPGDAPPITPSMLMGDVFRREEEVGAVELNASQMSKRARFLCQLSELLKKRWKEEYLTQLVNHSKKFSERGCLKIGDLAFLVDGTKKRAEWPIVRVVDLFRGRDGLIRLVKIRCRNSEFLRPVQKLVPLEVASDARADGVDGLSRVGKVSETKSDASDPTPSNQVSSLEPSVSRTSSGRIIRKPKLLDL